MILRALQHNSEDIIAAALNVNVFTIRKKRDLLDDICAEAVDVLKDRRVQPNVFAILRKMKPVRQAEAAELMVSSNLYSHFQYPLPIHQEAAEQCDRIQLYRPFSS